MAGNAPAQKQGDYGQRGQGEDGVGIDRAGSAGEAEPAGGARGLQFDDGDADSDTEGSAEKENHHKNTHAGAGKIAGQYLRGGADHRALDKGKSQSVQPHSHRGT